MVISAPTTHFRLRNKWQKGKLPERQTKIQLNRTIDSLGVLQKREKTQNAITMWKAGREVMVENETDV